MSRSRLPRLDLASRLAAGIVILQFLVLGIVQPLVRPHAYSDFATFHAAARCFAAGGNPYDATVLRATGRPEWQGWTGRYFYAPPFAAGALRPLAALPFDTARRVWVLLEAAAYAAATLLLCRRVLPQPRTLGAVLAATLAASFAPMVFDLRLGSVSGWLLLLVAAALTYRSRGSEWRAALCLAAAVLLKLVPAILLAAWILRREWRLVFRTAGAMAAIAAAALPWTGVTSYAWYVRDALPALAHENFTWFSNQSFDAALGRILTPNPDTTPWLAAPGLHRALVTALVASTLGLVAWMAHRTRRAPRGGPQDWLVGAAALAAGPLVVRVAWEYLVVLALPWFFVWAARAASGRTSRAGVLLGAAAWMACAWPWPYFEAPIRSGAGLLLEMPRTAGLVVILLLTAHRVRHDGASSA